MKKIFLLLIVIGGASCRSYLDEKPVNNENGIQFQYLTDSNRLTYNSEIKFSADTETFFPQHYEISLPKKLKDWQTSNQVFFVEYDDKQIIAIDPDYVNKKDHGNWKLIDSDNTEVEKMIMVYWGKKYNSDYIFEKHPERITKIYTDGKAKILLYNIKKKNFDNYFELIKSFKYMN
jgi:hypothetical protein